MKRRTLRLLSLLLVLCIVLSLLPGTALASIAITVTQKTSGTCGDNLTWRLDSNGTLTISGTGDMEDYGYNNTPWHDTSIMWVTPSITSIVISNGVTSIGEMAFYGCNNLTSVTIPNSVSSIGGLAFYGCTALTSVTIPDGVTSIGDQAFQDCTGLVSVTIPGSVSSIEDFAFSYCSALTSVTIGDGVTGIYRAAFWGCDSLTDVYYGGSKSQWGQIKIEESNTPLLNATIHYNSTESGRVWLENLPIKESDRYTGNQGDSFIKKIGTRNGTTDTTGESYAHGLEAWIARWNYKNESSWAWATYQLDGAYKTLSGKIALIANSYNIRNFNTTIEIWGDNKLLYSAILTPKLTQLPVSLDVSNVQLLKISLYDNEAVSGGTSFALGNFALDANNATPTPPPAVDQDLEKQAAYIQEHLDFLAANGDYDSIISNTWARAIADGLDTDKANFADTMYDVLNTPGEFLGGKELSIFKNPYEAILPAFILKYANASQIDFNVKFQNSLLSSVNTLESLCEMSDPQWKVHSSEYKTYLEKLIANPKDYAKENPQFYKMAQSVFSKLDEKSLNKLLYSYQKVGTLMSALDTYSKVVEWVADCLNYNALVSAYLSTSDEIRLTFRDINAELAKASEASDLLGDASNRARYAKYFDSALQSYDRYVTDDQTSLYLLGVYTDNGLGKAGQVFSGTVVKSVCSFLEAKGLAGSQIFAAIQAYKIGWKISEHITNNGDIQDCRELARAYYYMENALLRTVRTDRQKFLNDSSYQNALKFDASYTMLQDLEIETLSNYIHYLQYQQTSFVQAIQHFGKHFNEAEILGLTVEIADWQKSFCHDAQERLVALNSRKTVFKDVQDNAYYVDAVRWAYDNKITQGTSEDKFSPDEMCTRGQVVTFLWRAFGEPDPTKNNHRFEDVSENDYYYKAVLWAVEKNITVGTSANKFSPNSTCSTADILTFIYRACGVGIDGWYAEAATWAENEGLLEDTELTVSPSVECPRKAVVTFLYREFGPANSGPAGGGNGGGGIR